MTSSILLKLLTVASTGLLMSLSENLEHYNVPMMVLDRFQTDSFNSSSIGAMSIFSAIAYNHQNLSYPPGISEEMAF